MYAITPRGIGKSVGARSVRSDWPMTNGETFTVVEWNQDMVLNDDEISLRLRTDDEDLTLYKENKINELKISFDGDLRTNGVRSSALGSDHNYDAEQHNIDWMLACVLLTATSPNETPLITCDDLLGNEDSKGQRAHTASDCGQLIFDCMGVIQGMKNKFGGLKSDVYAILSTDQDPKSEIDKIVW